MSKIDIQTQEGLDALKKKADFYGHYAEFLMVKELIAEIENLRNDIEVIFNALKEQKMNELGFRLN